MQAQRGTRVTAEQPSSTSVPPSLLAASSDCCTSMDRKRMGHLVPDTGVNPRADTRVRRGKSLNPPLYPPRPLTRLSSVHKRSNR